MGNPLRSNTMLFIVVTMALIAQLPHTQHVYRIVAHSEGEQLSRITPWVFAIALDLAVLVFVARARTNQSWAFAAYAVAINVCYYFWPQGHFVWPGSAAVPMLLLSFGLPIVIALYSHELLGHHEPEAKGATPLGPLAKALAKARTLAPGWASPLAQSLGTGGAQGAPAHTPGQPHQNGTAPVSARPGPSEDDADIARYKELYGHIEDTDERRQVAVTMREDYGLNNTQIATVFGVTGATVGRWFKKMEEVG